MKTTHWLRCTALVLAVILFCAIPLPQAQAEDDSLNKGAMVGLFVVVIGVLAWLGLRSDLEDYRYSQLEEDPGEWAQASFALQEPPVRPLDRRGAVSIYADGVSVAF